MNSSFPNFSVARDFVMVVSYRICRICFSFLVVALVSVVSFRLFRWFRFAFFDGFVSAVSVVSFRSFRFVVSGFSTCRKTELLCAQAGHRLRFRFKF